MMNAVFFFWSILLFSDYYPWILPLGVIESQPFFIIDSTGSTKSAAGFNMSMFSKTCFTFGKWSFF